MKVKINGEEFDDIIRIDISNHMIDFERINDSFFYYFTDIGDKIKNIIIEK